MSEYCVHLAISRWNFQKLTADQLLLAMASSMVRHGRRYGPPIVMIRPPSTPLLQLSWTGRRVRSILYSLRPLWLVLSRGKVQLVLSAIPAGFTLTTEVGVGVFSLLWSTQHLHTASPRTITFLSKVSLLLTHLTKNIFIFLCICLQQLQEHLLFFLK